MSNKAITLLVIGGIALAAIAFWNPTICGSLNGLNTGFDFCDFKSIDQKITEDPHSTVIAPPHHFHHEIHPHQQKVIISPSVAAIPTAPHHHFHHGHGPSPAHPHPAAGHHHLTLHPHPATHPVKKLTKGATGAKLDAVNAAASYGYTFLGETLDNRMSYN